MCERKVTCQYCGAEMGAPEPTEWLMSEWEWVAWMCCTNTECAAESPNGYGNTPEEAIAAAYAAAAKRPPNKALMVPFFSEKPNPYSDEYYAKITGWVPLKQFRPLQGRKRLFIVGAPKLYDIEVAKADGFCEDYERYNAHSLMVLAERMKREDIKPEDLRINTLAYIRGYKQAQRDAAESFHKALLRPVENGVAFTINGKTTQEILETMKKNLDDLEANADTLVAKCITATDPRSGAECEELEAGTLYPVEQVSMGQTNTTIIINGRRHNSVMFEFFVNGEPVDIYRDARWNS